MTLLAVGRVTRAHGVRGEVAVEPLTEVADRFAPGALLRTEDGGTLTVRAVRPHGGRLLVTFEEVPDRTAAEALRGEVLLVPAAETPPMAEEGRFWIHQVVGLEVSTDDGRRVGEVREVLRNPGNDLWVAEEDGREVLIPAVREVVISVDLDAGRVVIRALPGLLPDA